jgi:hypothetical protein
MDWFLIPWSTCVRSNPQGVRGDPGAFLHGRDDTTPGENDCKGYICFRPFDYLLLRNMKKRWPPGGFYSMGWGHQTVIPGGMGGLLL